MREEAKNKNGARKMSNVASVLRGCHEKVPEKVFPEVNRL